MLFPSHLYPRLRDGSVRLAFRHWRKPAAKSGGRQRIPGGELTIDRVGVTSLEDITDADAVLAGFASRADLLRDLGPGREGALYRVELHYAGEDPRERMREQSVLSSEQATEITASLARLDKASRRGPWTESVLRVVADNPEGTRAADLAAQLGRETLPFKADVRKLKELGLTESLDVGYRLSRRGKTYIDVLGRAK